MDLKNLPTANSTLEKSKLLKYYQMRAREFVPGLKKQEQYVSKKRSVITVFIPLCVLYI